MVGCPAFAPPLFSDEPKWQDSALDYNFPWALDSEAKEDALSNLDVKWTDYFTLDGIREVSDNEQLNQQANSLLVFNAVQQSQAQMGDLISLATGVGEAAIAARSLIALYKSKGLWGKVDDVVEGLGGTVDIDPVAGIDYSFAPNFWVNDINFQQKRVYQRDSLINIDTIDSIGRTNLERMQSGIAPLGPDGESINLHHLTQSNDGAIAEVTQTMHVNESAILHINPNTVPSGIDRTAFNAWKRNYWMSRANDFNPEFN